VWRRQAFAQPETRAKEGSAQDNTTYPCAPTWPESLLLCRVRHGWQSRLAATQRDSKVSLRENVLRSFSDLFYRNDRADARRSGCQDAASLTFRMPEAGGHSRIALEKLYLPPFFPLCKLGN